METNLAATSAARKERLIALRKRKQAVESGDGESSYVPKPPAVLHTARMDASTLPSSLKK